MIKTQGLPRKEKVPSISHLAKNFIDEHYTENIKLEDVAQAVSTNVYSLAKIFKSEILLINTDMTITRIALSVGYNNSNYFQNVFKDFMQMTPKEYRKRWTKSAFTSTVLSSLGL